MHSKWSRRVDKQKRPRIAGYRAGSRAAFQFIETVATVPTVLSSMKPP